MDGSRRVAITTTMIIFIMFLLIITVRPLFYCFIIRRKILKSYLFFCIFLTGFVVP